MAVYSYYYGASVERGIGIQAQSRELESLPLRSVLKDLSSMHALSAADHDGEMLSYMLSSGGYGILGLSYTESPKSSGYGRSAPCGLIYVAPDGYFANVSVELGKIVNFAQFQKPASPTPAPHENFPLNESGYSFHSSSPVLASLVEGLMRVVFSDQSAVLLVALPQGKSSDYATARYAISEALNYLPVPLRTKVRFFTGLPVAENVTDPLAGFDNAVNFGANVIFCPHEFFARLKSHRTCIALDMEQPAAQVGAYSNLLAYSPDPSAALIQVNGCLTGSMNYETLNKAAQRVLRGEVRTLDMVSKELAYCQDALGKLERKAQKQEAENERLNQQYQKLQQDHSLLVKEHNGLDQEYHKLIGLHNDLVGRYNALIAQHGAPANQPDTPNAPQSDGKRNRRNKAAKPHNNPEPQLTAPVGKRRFRSKKLFIIAGIALAVLAIGVGVLLAFLL